jgi:hypothetical protein
MTNRIQTIRSSVPLARPVGRFPGELYTNWADLQLGVINASNTPIDLIAVRFFSSTAAYNLGDFVIFNGDLWCAIGPVAPGPFAPNQWAVLVGEVDFAVRKFSPTSSYATGDFVTYNSVLYVANQAVSPGTFNPLQWDQIGPGGVPGPPGVAGPPGVPGPPGGDVSIGPLPPPNPVDGDLWFNPPPVDELTIWYDPGTGAGGSWVLVSGGASGTPPSGGPFLPLGGGTMLGNLILNADPTAALGAATKEYVDDSIATAIAGLPPGGGGGGGGGGVTGSGWTKVIDNVMIQPGNRTAVFNNIPLTGGTLMMFISSLATNTLTGNLYLDVSADNGVTWSTQNMLIWAFDSLSSPTYIVSTGFIIDGYSNDFGICTVMPVDDVVSPTNPGVVPQVGPGVAAGGGVTIVAMGGFTSHVGGCNALRIRAERDFIPESFVWLYIDNAIGSGGGGGGGGPLVVPPPPAANWATVNFSYSAGPDVLLVDVPGGVAFQALSNAQTYQSQYCSAISVGSQPIPPYTLDIAISSLGLFLDPSAGYTGNLSFGVGMSQDLNVYTGFMMMQIGGYDDQGRWANNLVNVVNAAYLNYDGNSLFPTGNGYVIPSLGNKVWVRIIQTMTTTSFQISTDGLSYLPVYTTALFYTIPIVALFTGGLGGQLPYFGNQAQLVISSWNLQGPNIPFRSDAPPALLPEEPPAPLVRATHIPSRREARRIAAMQKRG